MVKDLTTVCVEKLPGTKYDKYFVEEFVKKIKTNEELEEFIANIRALKVGSLDDFESIVSSKGSKAD